MRRARESPVFKFEVVKGPGTSLEQFETFKALFAKRMIGDSEEVKRFDKSARKSGLGWQP